MASRADNICTRCNCEVEPPIDCFDKWFNNLVCSECWVDEDGDAEWAVFDYRIFSETRKILNG